MVAVREESDGLTLIFELIEAEMHSWGPAQLA